MTIDKSQLEMSKAPRARPPIESLIHVIRGQRVILDSDLAALYGATNKRLLQQFSRNRDRFPADFAFILDKTEAAVLRLQNEAAKGRGGRRTAPVVFTEHGAIMAATILNSEEAVAMELEELMMPSFPIPEKKKRIGFRVSEEMK